MKRIKTIILLLLLSIVLFGCGGKQDINQLLFVSAVGIDKTEDGFKVVAQIVNKNILVPNPPQIAPIYIHTSEGETIAQAFTNMTNTLPNRPFLINLQLLVFSEDIAKDSIEDYLHLFVNFNEAQHEYNVIVTKDVSAEDFLSQISAFSVFPTRILINKIKAASDEFGIAKETFVEEVIDGVRSESKVVLLTSVTIKGDIKKGQSVDKNKTTIIETLINISDMAILKKGKLVGWLNKEESRAYNFVQGNIERTLLVVDGNEDNKISCSIYKSKGKIKVDIKDGKPSVKFEVEFYTSIVEDTSGQVKLENEYFDDVKQKLEKQIKDNINKLIEKSKNEFDVDLFCLADYFYKNEPKWWKENKDNFEEIYKNLMIEVNVKANIKR